MTFFVFVSTYKLYV